MYEFLSCIIPHFFYFKKGIALKCSENRGVRWGLCHVCLAGVCALHGRSQWLMGEDGEAPLSSLMPPSAVRLCLCSGALSVGLLSTSSPRLSFVECHGYPSIVLLLTGVVDAKNTKIHLFSNLSEWCSCFHHLSFRPGWKSDMSKIKLQGEHSELCVADKIVKMLYVGQGVTLGFWQVFSNSRVDTVHCGINIHFVQWLPISFFFFFCFCCTWCFKI